MKRVYVCQFGLYHDKPVAGGVPSSNNGFLYSAIAHAIGLPVDFEKVQRTYLRCRKSPIFGQLYFHINRLPDKEFPPISRDELIGLHALNIPIFFSYTLENFDWRYYRQDIEVSLWRQLKGLWKLRGQHRNYVWKTPVLDAYPIVFRLGLADRYFFKKADNRSVKISEWLAWKAYKFWTLRNGSAGELNILWLQCLKINDKTMEKVDIKKSLLEYFGENHIFNN